MAIDDRKGRILVEIVTLYADGGEPIGSGALSRQFNMAVSSATLRNEMAALTKLGLLEQPHTSAGRVPTAKGYRYYVDNLLACAGHLSEAEKACMETLFAGLDYDHEKLAQGAARALSDYLQLAVVTTTPRSEDICIAHFEVIQVGRFSAAVLAVTAAGGVKTRVAKVDIELGEGDANRISEALNRTLRFVVSTDITAGHLQALVGSLDGHATGYRPIIDAALTLLNEVGRPSVYFEGFQYLLRWPELEGHLRPALDLLRDNTRMERLVQPGEDGATVLFGEELEQPIPGLCIVSSRYLAGGGLSGVIAVAGPTRLRFNEIIPRLNYFSELLGKGMAG